MEKAVSQDRFIKEALQSHNNYRLLHSVDVLEHDSRLSNLAQEWAEHLANNGNLKYKDSTYMNAHVGENIVRYNLNETKTFYIKGSQVTDEWYLENKFYDYTGNSFNSSIGHFTQMIWKDTKKVGFGFSLDDDGNFYVVANYFPAGNYKNKFKENVIPVKIRNPEYLSNSTKPKREEPKEKNQFLKAMMSEVLQTNKKNNERDKCERSPLNKNSNVASRQTPNVNQMNQFDDVQLRFINEALECHNECREIHGVEPLLHNSVLSKIAQSYADHLASINRMTHSKNTYKNEKLGENLAYAFDSRVDFYSGEKASLQWYDEINMHDFNKDHQRGTGHFTQLVWKDTKEVGFGVAKAKDGSWYAVANYYPAGNFISRFTKNVMRPLH